MNPASPVPGHEARSGPLVVEVIDNLEALAKFIPEWRSFLQTSRAESSFYQDPEYVQVYLSGRRATTFPEIAVVRENDRIVAIAPGFIETARFRFRLSVITLFTVPIRRLRIFGDALILAAGTEHHMAAEAVLRALNRRMRGRFSAIYLETLPVAGDLFGFVTGAKAAPYRPIVLTASREVVREIHLTDTFERYMATRSKNFKQNVNRRVKQFHAAFQGDVKVVKYAAAADAGVLMDRIDRVFRSTWQSRTFGGKQRNTPEQIAFVTAMAERGWLRAYVLEGSGQPIAYVLGYHYRQTYLYEEPGYDQDWRALAPGTVLMHELLRDLFETDRPAVFDFGFGENQYKRQLANAEYDACSAYVAPPGVWLGLFGLQKATNHVYVQVREFLKRHGWDRRIRGILKRRSPAADAQPQPAAESKGSSGMGA